MNNLNLTLVPFIALHPKNKNFKVAKKNPFFVMITIHLGFIKRLARWWNDIKVQVSQLNFINWFEINLNSVKELPTVESNHQQNVLSVLR